MGREGEKTRPSEETKEYVPMERTGQIPEEELNKTNTSCLSDKRFKVMVIKMSTKLR